MPRFHPSFLFEERLAEQLRALAEERNAGTPVGPLLLLERRS